MYNQLALPLTRKSDPATSLAASRVAADNQAGHERRILDALRACGPMITEQIAAAAGMDYHAVAKRMKLMEERQIVGRTVTWTTPEGRTVYLSRDNVAGRPCAIWHAGESK